jgi:hypothetical protein
LLMRCQYFSRPHEASSTCACHSACACHLQAERARAAHCSLSLAVLTARRASPLFAPADPLRPCMDAVLECADSAGAVRWPLLAGTLGLPAGGELPRMRRHDTEGQAGCLTGSLWDLCPQ